MENENVETTVICRCAYCDKLIEILVYLAFYSSDEDICTGVVCEDCADEVEIDRDD